ncbi:MAG: DEAD/DEAH box helicase [Tannerella sp.]|uniref:DEAD/DEAH box helicase n=1 Tax=uncultured Coprobacter sp. TaxID=1720550 RepID=UPI00261890F1|nr:DEAD/DEAH box helicase [uncultured Coprobacter sp.]MBS6268176.1 DEAD/DEAH box helicase [Tannerella sp.]
MKTFEELGIDSKILKAISEIGFESPMPVQEQVIPLLLAENTDIVALAQTGTGKTAAFGLPVIQKIDVSDNYPQALILSPTRELCLQIASDLNDYSKYISGLKILPVYGGSSIESQIRTLKKGVQIIVATPGRLIDLMNRKMVKLDRISTVIMDEADEMLNMGFTESINEILAAIPEERNMLLFSATMPAEIAKIAKNYMSNPKEVVIGSKNEGAKNIKHVYYLVHAKDKYLALKRIADYYPNIYGIIFCRTRRETQEIADQLIQDGYNADSLHGELSQAQRDAVMQKFRVKNLQLLVATDVAARGLDVDNLTHVINYGLPDDIETYTHRSGRTGRAGKTGTSIAIIHVKEKGRMRDIEKIIGKKFEKGHIPTGDQICEKQLFNLVDKIEKVKVNEEEIASYLPSIFRKLEWLSNEDLIKRIVSLEFNRLIDYYADASELDIPEDRNTKDRGNQRGERTRSKARKAEEGYSRLFINLGKADGFYPNTLIEMVNDNVKGHASIGKIDVLPNFSFFEVEEKSARSIIRSLKNISFFGKRVSVEPADKKENSGKREHSGRKGGFGKRDSGGRSSQKREGFRNEYKSSKSRGRENSKKKRR